MSQSSRRVRKEFAAVRGSAARSAASEVQIGPDEKEERGQTIRMQVKVAQTCVIQGLCKYGGEV
jgi:hypothetical protein